MGIETKLNLKSGQIIKNYIELCNILDLKPTKGKGRKYHERELERYCTYRKEGQKYIIEEVFAEPKQKIDRRKNNNDTYGLLIQQLIKVLLKNSNGNLFNPLNYFLREMGMINDNYKFCEDKIPSLAHFLKVDEYNIYEFYNINRRNFRDIFETALNRLQKDGVLVWEKIEMVKITLANIEKNELNTIKLDSKDTMYVKINNTTIHRKARSDEIKLVELTQKNLLKNKGYKNIQQIIFSGKYYQFKKELQEVLFEKGNIDYLYYCYNIIINEDYVVTEEEFDIGYNKSILNNLIAINIINNSEERHKKVVEKYEHDFGQPNIKVKKDVYRYNSNYIRINSMLVENLISLDARDIKDNILDIQKTLKTLNENKKSNTLSPLI